MAKCANFYVKLLGKVEHVFSLFEKISKVGVRIGFQKYSFPMISRIRVRIIFRNNLFKRGKR